jgi:hypothetical protein
MKSRHLEKILGLIFYPIIFLLALILIFEEWLWEQVLIFTNFIANWSMTLLAIPWLLLLPVKFLAMKLMLHQNKMGGLAVLLAAKILGTAIVARVFTLTRTQVLKISWFKKLYELIIYLLAWAKNWLHQARAYQLARLKILQIKMWWAGRRPGFLSLRFKRQLRRKKNHFKNGR